MAARIIRVLHVDDDRDHHELIKTQLGRLCEDISLQRVESRRAASAAMEEEVYDCVLTDDEMPEDAGAGWLKELRRRGNIVPFVILSEIDGEAGPAVRLKAFPDDEFHVVVDCFHFDLLGYWIRRLDDKYRELIRTDKLRAELFRRTPGRAAELRETAKTLTSREAQILELIGTGKSNMEIADELFISYKTVKNHVSNIFAKLGIHTRAEAIHFIMTTKISGG